MSTRTRGLITIVLVLAAGALARAARTSARPPDANLDTLPMTIGAWSGRDAGELDEASARILAADAYLNRSYRSAAAASGVPVGLYIAYYAEQRPGVSIHSPLHCLPGNGWEPLEVSTIDAPADVAGNAAPRLRRMIVSKNLDRAVVLYWYAVHGRMLAGELSSKLWLLHDSVSLHRTDAALVRIVVPAGRDAASVNSAEHQGLAFARDLLPFLSHLWS
jgi:EpsI family protein